MYVKDISKHVTDSNKNKQIRAVDWQEYDALIMVHLNPRARQEYDALIMVHLNPRAQQYGGFTPGRRVFGRTPQMQIGAGGCLDIRDFAAPDESQAAQTHQVIAKLRGPEKASL